MPRSKSAWERQKMGEDLHTVRLSRRKNGLPSALAFSMNLKERSRILSSACRVDTNKQAVKATGAIAGG